MAQSQRIEHVLYVNAQDVFGKELHFEVEQSGGDLTLYLDGRHEVRERVCVGCGHDRPICGEVNQPILCGQCGGVYEVVEDHERLINTMRRIQRKVEQHKRGWEELLQQAARIFSPDEVEGLKSIVERVRPSDDLPTVEKMDEILVAYQKRLGEAAQPPLKP